MKRGWRRRGFIMPAAWLSAACALVVGNVLGKSYYAWVNVEPLPFAARLDCGALCVCQAWNEGDVRMPEVLSDGYGATLLEPDDLCSCDIDDEAAVWPSWDEDGGDNYWSMSVPLWMLALPPFVLGGRGASLFWIDRTRRRLGLCRACGYDVRQSPERCPECGV